MEKDIIQNLISRLGQSQDERVPAELSAAFAPVDGRTPAQLLAQVHRLAEHLHYYRENPDSPAGKWTDFFPSGDDDALLGHPEGQVPPHLALLLSFLRLYEYPQAAANRITGRHLDFQYCRVLGFTPRTAKSDHAHVLVELKKRAAPIAITTGRQLSAGKDATGVERIYRPVREVIVGHARVAELKSVHYADRRLYFAPITNSSDGLGGELDRSRPMWRPFGDSSLPLARPGFAFSSPLLRMAEGERQITLNLALSNLIEGTHSAGALAGAFDAYVSGPEGWLGPFPLTGSLAGNRLSLSLVVATTDPAVADYDASIHGQRYSACAPILHLQLRADASLRYGDLANLTLGVTGLRVKVDGVQNTLVLESDGGGLNPKRAFQPFGAQPVSGSRFMIGCTEALSKQLTNLSIRLTWQAAPPTDLTEWYRGYEKCSRMKNGVSAALSYRDRSGQEKLVSIALMPHDNDVSTLSPNRPAAAVRVQSLAERLYALEHAGSHTASHQAERYRLEHSLFEVSQSQPPQTRSGFVTVQLVEDFLHADYRKESIERALKKEPNALNEPYTPTVQSISLSYEAESEQVDVSLDSVESFGERDLQFFHVGCFGQMREHAFLRASASFPGDQCIRLLPAYDDEGELLIGMTGVAAGDSVSLLMQVAEGSADPELPAQTLTWSVLCDNYWRTLTPAELVLDTSNSLRTSGVVAVTLPHRATTEHTLMPSGMVWLRATVHEHSGAACQLLAVAANAVEVRGSAPTHLASALPAGAISRLRVPQATVKGITQPYASFGGRMAESNEQLRRRAAERLRHRDRCLTAWDYERMVLEAFPSLHKVKCIPHASASSWLAPGHVMLVVIPDLRNQNAVDPLCPRADIDTLVRVADFVQAHCGLQVSLKVKNPFYQRVRLDFKVRMRAGCSYNYYRGRLQQALLETLAPWAFETESTRRIEFGGRIYRSVLLDFVEELPYVDFVTDFRLQTFHADGTPTTDRAEVSAATPDAILVSDASHLIAEVSDI